MASLCRTVFLTENHSAHGASGLNLKAYTRPSATSQLALPEDGNSDHGTGFGGDNYSVDDRGEHRGNTPALAGGEVKDGECVRRPPPD
jgi:hypothetical protein